MLNQSPPSATRIDVRVYKSRSKRTCRKFYLTKKKKNTETKSETGLRPCTTGIFTRTGEPRCESVPFGGPATAGRHGQDGHQQQTERVRFHHDASSGSVARTAPNAPSKRGITRIRRGAKTRDVVGSRAHRSSSARPMDRG